MASVTSPSTTTTIRLCGLSRYVTDETQALFETRLTSFIADAAGDVAMDVGESAYDGSGWSTREAAALANAVAYRAGALFLLDPEVRKLLGVQQPLLMEDAESVAAVAERLDARADRIIGLATAGTSVTPYAAPVVSASTFAVSSTDRLPSERVTLLDETDDISAENTADG